MAAPLRAMVSQLALAPCHWSQCQLVLRRGCRAREGHKECTFFARWLDESPDSTVPNEQPLKSTTGHSKSLSGSLFVLSSFLYFWLYKGATCLLHALGPFISHREGIVKLCLFYSTTFHSWAPRAAGPWLSLSTLTHFMHFPDSTWHLPV